MKLNPAQTVIFAFGDTIIAGKMIGVTSHAIANWVCRGGKVPKHQWKKVLKAEQRLREIKGGKPILNEDRLAEGSLVKRRTVEKRAEKYIGGGLKNVYKHWLEVEAWDNQFEKEEARQAR